MPVECRHLPIRIDSSTKLCNNIGLEYDWLPGYIPSVGLSADWQCSDRRRLLRYKVILRYGTGRC